MVQAVAVLEMAEQELEIHLSVVHPKEITAVLDMLLGTIIVVVGVVVHLLVEKMELHHRVVLGVQAHQTLSQVLQ